MYEDELSRVTLKAETLKKVKKFFGDEIPKEKKKAAEDLCLRMTEVLYMMIMLEEDVQKNGIKTPNGNGKLASNPSIGSYNNLMKTYISLFKQMTEFLGTADKNKKALLDFMKK